MLKGKTVAPLTLGCKVNQYETDGMIELLKEAGMTVIISPDVDLLFLRFIFFNAYL